VIDRSYVRRVILIVLVLAVVAAFTHFVLEWSFGGVFLIGIAILIAEVGWRYLTTRPRQVR
jgi:hypothetical protein